MSKIYQPIVIAKVEELEAKVEAAQVESAEENVKIETKIDWKTVSETSELIASGHQIGEAELLFAKIEDEEIQKQIDPLNNQIKTLKK